MTGLIISVNLSTFLPSSDYIFPFGRGALGGSYCGVALDGPHIDPEWAATYRLGEPVAKSLAYLATCNTNVEERWMNKHGSPAFLDPLGGLL